MIFSFSIAPTNNMLSEFVACLNIMNTVALTTYSHCESLQHFSFIEGHYYTIELAAMIGTQESIHIRSGYLRSLQMVKRTQNLKQNDLIEYACLLSSNTGTFLSFLTYYRLALLRCRCMRKRYYRNRK